MRRKSSIIWTLFDQMNADSANCNHCGKYFSWKDGGTILLKLHLKSTIPNYSFWKWIINKNPKSLTPLQKCKKQLSETDS